MKESYYTLADLQLCVRQWGAQPNVIVLHGWLDQAAAWDPVAEFLHAKGYDIAIPDQRGHGCSDHASKDTHYHFPDYVRDIALLHESWENKPVHLIGHSMGGTIASIYAALFPERIQSLILIEGLGPIEESDEQAVRRYKTHLQQRCAPKTHRVFSSVDEAIKRLQQRYPSLPEQRASFLARRMLIQKESGWMWRFDPRHKEKSAISFSLSRHQHILSSIQCPCSIIMGNQSPYKDWIDVSKRSAWITTLTKTYAIDGGHALHMENHEQLCVTLDTIL